LSVLVFPLAVVAIRKVGAAIAVVVASIRNYDVPAFSEDRSPILVADYCGLGKDQLHLFSQIKRQEEACFRGVRYSFPFRRRFPRTRCIASNSLPKLCLYDGHGIRNIIAGSVKFFGTEILFRSTIDELHRGWLSERVKKESDIF
jgi:hypothetical protein